MLVHLLATSAVIAAASYVAWNDAGSLTESAAVVVILIAIGCTAWWAPFDIFFGFFIVLGAAGCCWHGLRTSEGKR